MVATVIAVALVEKFMYIGSLTVFDPTNMAFEKLPTGTLGTLVMPENKITTKILTYHILNGKLKAKDIAAAIKKGKGKDTFDVNKVKSVSSSDERLQIDIER